MRLMRQRTAIFTTIILSASLILPGLLSGCGGSSSSPSTNVIDLNGRYSSEQVTSPVNLIDPYPIGLGLNNDGQAVLGTERGGAVATRAARPHSLHPYPPMAPYYLWQSPSLTQLPSGYDFGQINDSGTIVANSTAGIAGTYSAGTETPLAVPSGYTQTEAEAINSAGDVAGVATASGAIQAFLWKGGSTTSLGLPAGITEASVAGINTGDQIIGQYTDSQDTTHFFLWSQGTLTDLGSFDPAAINTSGEIAGATAQNTPAVWISGTVSALPLPNPAVYGAELGFPVAINDSGEVVGDVLTSKASFPALWSGGKLYNLANALESSYSATIYDVYAINNSGQILAAASTSTGGTVVLLMPIPPV